MLPKRLQREESLTLILSEMEEDSKTCALLGLRDQKMIQLSNEAIILGTPW